MQQPEKNIQLPLLANAELRADGVDEPIGYVYFQQNHLSDPMTLVTVYATNVFPAGEHGFHVHESGDTSRGCESMGEHFSLPPQNHGGRSSAVRHTGDLGNVTSDHNGIINEQFYAPVPLWGRKNIVGRGIVLHKNKDDLGQGGNAESLKTGNSGARIACGPIFYQM